ncbi:hypothetical protein VMCG_07300 [Cytospora schulzeri]|uniref:Uncharacterized protein n=1 Tax=Cytospora schulzeri TaxID=448051 RepID=A0A423WAI8_9PEZI|nr:hypothetical protein VMCG_07300 [Valsa malicola]
MRETGDTAGEDLDDSEVGGGQQQQCTRQQDSQEVVNSGGSSKSSSSLDRQPGQRQECLAGTGQSYIKQAMATRDIADVDVDDVSVCFEGRKSALKEI